MGDAVTFGWWTADTALALFAVLAILGWLLGSWIISELTASRDQ